MPRFSPFLFVIVLCTSVLAQSNLDESNAAARAALITAAKYCANIEVYSDSQVPRIFARMSAGWREFDSRAAWSQAGSPKPVALAVPGCQDCSR